MPSYETIMDRLDDLANNEAVLALVDKIGWIVAGLIGLGILALAIVGHATGAL